tara:strand:+ start:528 stop:1016 length:489 start_codon:yes stop_codon:yes gene_type:complete
MILYCGVTKEEIFGFESSPLPIICVDLMIDGGTADEPLNIYEVDTWKQLLEKYKDVDYIFIDGGIYGSFKDLESKKEILDIIQIFCKKALIIYGDHMLKRFRPYTIGVRKGKDLLQREQNLPFTYIPVRQYTMDNFKAAYNQSHLLTRMQKLRVMTEYSSKF